MQLQTGEKGVTSFLEGGFEWSLARCGEQNWSVVRIKLKNLELVEIFDSIFTFSLSSFIPPS